MGFSPADRLCIPVPLYHCFGMVLGTLTCLTHGACMVFPAESFDALSVLQTVQEERCTALHGVPTMFIGLLDHPQFAQFDLSSLRTGVMAGSPCPIEVMKRVTTLMHMSQVTIGYGMTETSPLSFQSSADTPLDKRVSTVGQVHPHVEVKIVDNDGHIVPHGETGELLTRGYSVMLGYWDDPQKTADSIDKSGWMHSGDLAVMDAEGYVNIVGRVKDMVIRGGENIYPREVEEFFYRHPKIQEVQVIGVPDDRFGEELCAWIKLRDGEQASIDDMRALPGPDRPLQDSALHRICRQLSHDHYRQDPEVRHAPANEGKAGAERQSDRLNADGSNFVCTGPGEPGLFSLQCAHSI
jgi:fatty-acyl-CoA synthase